MLGKHSTTDWYFQPISLQSHSLRASYPKMSKNHLPTSKHEFWKAEDQLINFLKNEQALIQASYRSGKTSFKKRKSQFAFQHPENYDSLVLKPICSGLGKYHHTFIQNFLFRMFVRARGFWGHCPPEKPTWNFTYCNVGFCFQPNVSYSRLHGSFTDPHLSVLSATFFSL